MQGLNFATPSDAMVAVRSVFDEGFWRLTEWNEIETGASLFGDVDNVVSDSP